MSRNQTLPLDFKIWDGEQTAKTSCPGSGALRESGVQRRSRIRDVCGRLAALTGLIGLCARCDLMQGGGQARRRAEPRGLPTPRGWGTGGLSKGPEKGHEGVREDTSERCPGGQGRQHVNREDVSGFVRCCWVEEEGIP